MLGIRDSLSVFVPFSSSNMVMMVAVILAAIAVSYGKVSYCDLLFLILHLAWHLRLVYKGRLFLDFHLPCFVFD